MTSVNNEQTYETLLFTLSGGIAEIAINRPEKLNALNGQVFADLRELVSQLVARNDIRVVIITGVGEKAFVAGADIKELSELQDADAGRTFAKNGQSVFTLIENSRVPFIAAVNGFALGGGCELALACHIRICSKNAKFGQPEVNLGIIPGYGGTQRLGRVVGQTIAADMILTSRMLDANEGAAHGLVSRIVASGDVLKSAREIASTISSKAPLAISAALKCLVEGIDGSLEDGLEIEADQFGRLAATEDFHEGTSAFLAKRTPNFSGR